MPEIPVDSVSKKSRRSQSVLKLQNADETSVVSKVSKNSYLSGFLSEVNEWQAIHKHDLF